MQSEPLPRWERSFSDDTKEPATRDVKSTQRPWQEKRAINPKRPPPQLGEARRPRPVLTGGTPSLPARRRVMGFPWPRRLCVPASRTKEQSLE